jgi:D-alanyl-D-alanine endopeptidase (penicillin-binding protein 7)
MWSGLAQIFLLLQIVVSPLHSVFTLELKNNEDNKSIVTLQSKLSTDNLPSKIDNDSLGVKLTASSAAVMDKKSGLVLWQQQADVVRPIASISKLMAALVFLEHNPGWQTEVTLEEKDFVISSPVKLVAGEKVSVKDLFYSSLIASDNNALLALVRASGKTQAEFVALMNAKAKDLKLTKTKFSDPTGLNSKNVSTANEVLLLAKTAFELTEIRQTASQATYDFVAFSGERHKAISTNKLLGSFLHLGPAKTGYIGEAGFCLVAEVSNENNQEILAVVLNSDNNDNRFQDLKALAYWIFQNFNWS